jgi:hypothetical protein
LSNQQLGLFNKRLPCWLFTEPGRLFLLLLLLMLLLLPASVVGFAVLPDETHTGTCDAWSELKYLRGSSSSSSSAATPKHGCTTTRSTS